MPRPFVPPDGGNHGTVVSDWRSNADRGVPSRKPAPPVAPAPEALRPDPGADNVVKAMRKRLSNYART